MRSGLGVAKRMVELLVVQWTHVHVHLSVGGEILVYRALDKKRWLPRFFLCCWSGSTPRRDSVEVVVWGGVVALETVAPP